MDKTEELNVELYRKLENELAEYRSELLSLSPEEMLTHAYEYAVREDIVFDLEYNDLTAEQAAALLKEKKPLEAIFQKWEHSDNHYMDLIRNAVEKKADELIRMRKRDEPEPGR